MDKGLILIIGLLILPVNAGIIYIDFNDLTGDNIFYMYLMQNDNSSTRYIKTLNTTIIQTLGTGYTYSLVIPVEQTKIQYDYSTDRPINYLFNNIERLISFGIIFLLIVLIGVLAWRKR